MIIQVSVRIEKFLVNSDCLFDHSDHQSSKRVTCSSLTTNLAIVIIGIQSISHNIFLSTDTS